MSTYLYSRISTSGQDLSNQQSSCELSGFKVDDIFSDVISGSTDCFSRKGFKQMLKVIKEGDTCIVYEISRVARNTLNALEVVKWFAENKIKFRIITLDAIDLTAPTGKLLVTMMAALAEMEKNLLVERIKTSLENAKSKGVVLGAPKSALKSPEEILQLSDLLKKGELTQKQIAEQMEISLSTLKRLKLEWIDTKKQKEYIKLCEKQVVQIIENRN
jgi:putative DNA-invertase from lambdoid prophage Rac